MTRQYLPIGLRAFTEREEPARPARQTVQDARWPAAVLLLDTETSTDPTQRLLFGSYRFSKWVDNRTLVCQEEGLIFADDLPGTDAEGLATLRRYVETASADVGPGISRRLQLRSRREFVDSVLWPIAFKARGLVVGFNLPFDLSRLAVDAGDARGAGRGGFSLVLWDYPDPRTGQSRAHPYRPRITIQHVDSKRAFIRFTRPAKVDAVNQRPADGAPPDRRYTFRGRVLDLRTLAFGLTSEGHSLTSACHAFGVAHGKLAAREHGRITESYIDYNRRDVLATQELLERLREEYDRHPIALDPCRAYSPASIAKAYLTAMRVTPPATQFQAVPRERFGQAMTAFYGGRAEARIRRMVVPVVYTDFTSMYPTVNALLGLWSLLTAERLAAVDATEAVRRLLAEVTLDRCFDPDTWREFVGFAEVMPDGDVLPARAKYDGREWNVGVNRLTAETPLWYPLPDVVASKVLTGKAPRIRRAFRLLPAGRQAGLKPVRLRGAARVDPRTDDLFQRIIEERHRLAQDPGLAETERKRHKLTLKILANAGSYGIFVEMTRKALRDDAPVPMTVYGRDQAFTVPTTAPEDAGRFAFPPAAALITAGARLMLALLERCVTDAGGTYASCDTDSMTIVASATGGLAPCPGGQERTATGAPAVRALSWQEVSQIVDRFAALNPYDRTLVPGSVLKIEDVNFTDETRREQRPLYAYVIAAKRYALFSLGPGGQPTVPESGYSEHGLGHLLNPIDPDSEDDKWIRHVWEGIIREALGLSTEAPPWLGRPAVMKSAVTTPSLLRQFQAFNRRKPYPEQIKPFNFLLSAPVDAFDRPYQPGTTGFHLIAPYTATPDAWLRQAWTDIHSGRPYRVTTADGRPGIRVRTYAEVLAKFRRHPERKSAAADGSPAHEDTIGLIGRRAVRVLSVTYIGKESNLIEQQQEGVLLDDPQAEYARRDDRDGWDAIRPWLSVIPSPHLAALSGVSAVHIRALRRGRKQPSGATRAALTASVERYLNERPDRNALDELQDSRDARRGRPIHRRLAPRRRWRMNPPPGL